MCSLYLRTSLFLTILVLLVSLPARAEKALTVYCFNYPLTYFAQRIGGNHVTVVFPVPHQVDPSSWTPDTPTIEAIQKADLIILNGAGYDSWTSKVSLPMLRIVDTSRIFKNNLIDMQTSVTHSHGPRGDHSHGLSASTTWLDFSQAALQARAIWKAFAKKDPQHKADFSSNFEVLKNDLLALDGAMEELTQKAKDINVLASLPIYQYLARRYQFNIHNLFIAKDTDPSTINWQKIEKDLLHQRADWIIWPQDPLPMARTRLEDMQVKSVIFSPCSMPPDQGDFITVMRQNIENIQPIFNQ